MAKGDMFQRMLGAAMLNVDTYEEVEADNTATSQAAAVVAMVAVASAIGAAGNENGSVFMAPICQIVRWLIWAGLTTSSGTNSWAARQHGENCFAHWASPSPGLLYFLGVIPFLGWIIQLVVWIWLLVAGIIAIRQALDFSTGKAILTAVIGWLAFMFRGVSSSAEQHWVEPAQRLWAARRVSLWFPRKAARRARGSNVWSPGSGGPGAIR